MNGQHRVMGLLTSVLCLNGALSIGQTQPSEPVPTAGPVAAATNGQAGQDLAGSSASPAMWVIRNGSNDPLPFWHPARDEEGCSLDDAQGGSGAQGKSDALP